MKVPNLFGVFTLILILSLAQRCATFTANNHMPSTTSNKKNNDRLNNISMRTCSSEDDVAVFDRRAMVKTFGAILLGGGVSTYPKAVFAKADCMSDCLKNCKQIAPKDSAYCLENCKSYCEQDDRTDGLSGSVSSQGGEMGILGTSTVVKGEDKPPSLSLPGLDFTSEKGKKLIGY